MQVANEKFYNTRNLHKWMFILIAIGKMQVVKENFYNNFHK